MKKLYTSFIALPFWVLPLLTQAAFDGDKNDVTDFIAEVITFIGSALVPLIFALALLVFLYGVFKYFIVGGADSSAQESGKQLMLYAIIGFVLMVSIWGIVNLIVSGLDLGGGTLENIPKAG